MSEDTAQKHAPARVVITGFMGAGKTTVARALAARLGCDALDLDEFVTAREGRGPQRIINEDGEPRFREIETHALRDALVQTRARVVALGGGAWTLQANRELIARAGYLSVWLDAPFELCWRRINEAAGEARPLARDLERARTLYGERRGLYALADRSVLVEAEKSVEGIAAEIEILLRPLQDERRAGEINLQGGSKDDV
ncbi:MAG: shikimate kinase [Pyrinomonadaceae bacterium]